MKSPRQLDVSIDMYGGAAKDVVIRSAISDLRGLRIISLLGSFLRAFVPCHRLDPASTLSLWRRRKGTMGHAKEVLPRGLLIKRRPLDLRGAQLGRRRAEDQNR